MFPYRLLFICSLVLVALSGCIQKQPQPNAARQIDYPFRGQGPLIEVDDTPPDSILQDIEYGRHGAIDLFGVELVGPIEPILNALDSIPFIRVEFPVSSNIRLLREDDRVSRFSTTIYIDDIPFGMNVEYRKTEPDLVHEVIFITSNPDDYICHTIVDRLTEYYGYPDINDFLEDIYAWYDMWDFHIRFRHLHSADGGWTFYMSR